MHPAEPLGRWVFGGADLTVFSCGKHKHTVGQSVLVVQTHTNRLSHFSFFLPANFLHLLFFSFLLTFCTCFFFLPANFLHLLFFLPANFLHFSFFLPANFLHLLFILPANFLHLLFFPSFIYFLEPTIYFLEPTIYCLFTFLTYIFNSFATTTWLFVATLFNRVPHHFQSCEAQCSLFGKIMMLD